jgi:hypothetical protein
MTGGDLLLIEEIKRKHFDFMQIYGRQIPKSLLNEEWEVYFYAIRREMAEAISQVGINVSIHHELLLKDFV